MSTQILRHFQFRAFHAQLDSTGDFFSLELDAEPDVPL